MKTRYILRPVLGLAVVVVTTIGLPVPASAQDQPPPTVARSFQDLVKRTEPGITLSVIDTAGNETTGDLAAISATSLTLSVDGTQRELSERDVIRVSRPAHGMSRMTGGLIGAGVGLAGMIGIGVACTTANEHGDGCGSEVPVIGFGVFVGSIAAGALLAGRTEEELLFQGGTAAPPALTVLLSPVLTKTAKGAALSLTW